MSKPEQKDSLFKLTPDDGNSPFDRFWAAWPRHRRKSAKAKCKSRWRRDKLDAKVDHILAVLKLWKVEWRKDGNRYVPAPLVWLNGQQWDCELADLAAHEKRIDEEQRETPASPIKPQMVQSQEQADQIEADLRVKAATLAENLGMVQWAQRQTGRAHVGFTASHLIRIKFDREER